MRDLLFFGDFCPFAIYALIKKNIAKNLEFTIIECQ